MAAIVLKCFYIILSRCSCDFLQIVILFFQLGNIYFIFCEVLSDRSYNLATFYYLKLLKLIFNFDLEKCEFIIILLL